MIIKDGIKMELVMPLSFNDRKTDSAPFEKKPDKGKRERAGSEADRWKTRSLWGLQVYATFDAFGVFCVLPWLDCLSCLLNLFCGVEYGGRQHDIENLSED